MAKVDLAFDMVCADVTMTFAGFERLESRKSLVPPLVALAPYKPDLIELRFPPAIEIGFVVALNGYPLAKPVAPLSMTTRNSAVSLAFYERKQGGNASIPSLFDKQPFAHLNFHNP